MQKMEEPDFELHHFLYYSFKSEKLEAGDTKVITPYVQKYLSVGEWIMDQSVAIAGTTSWFERRR